MSDLKSQIYNSNLKSRDVKVRSYNFSLAIIKFVNDLSSKRAFWSMGDQLLRAFTSIGANMIETQASSSKREFVKFYEIALKSANEAKYWLCLLRDSFGELQPKCGELLEEITEINKMIGSSVLTLKGRSRF